MPQKKMDTLVFIYELLKEKYLKHFVKDQSVTGIDIGFKVKSNSENSSDKKSGKKGRPALAIRLHVVDKRLDAPPVYFESFHKEKNPDWTFGSTDPAGFNFFNEFLKEIVSLHKKKAPLRIEDVFIQKHKDDKPSELDVVETNPMQRSRQIQTLPNRLRSTTVIQPGLSIGHTHRASGTLGSIVYKGEDPRPRLLSCWHVLAHPRSKDGERILHPGPSDGGREECDWIASLEIGETKKKESPTEEPWLHPFLPDIRGDAAVALLLKKPFLSQWVYPGQLGKEGEDSLPVMVDGVYSLVKKKGKKTYVLDPDDLGKEVWKSGKATGVTRGMIDGIGLYFFNYAGVGRVPVEGFKIVPTLADKGKDIEISAPGDSGALWVIDGQDGKDGEIKGVGLHVDGEKTDSPADEHALACHLDKVLEKLGVTLVHPLRKKQKANSNQGS